MEVLGIFRNVSVLEWLELRAARGRGFKLARDAVAALATSLLAGHPSPSSNGAASLPLFRESSSGERNPPQRRAHLHLCHIFSSCD